MDYVHNSILDWADWLKDGRCSPGMFPQSFWPDKGDVRTDRLGIPIHQPSETSPAGSSKLLLYRTDVVSERIHPVVLELSDTVKRVICCLYIYRMPFAQVTEILVMKSREVGDARHKAIKVVDVVV